MGKPGKKSQDQASKCTQDRNVVFLVAQMAKSLPATWEIWVRFLGREDPLEEEMATDSSILAWRFHGQKSLVGYSPWGPKELDTTEH